ncbi:SDR family NAD(P)-dependent oxidoreductase [Ammoniphilus sp. YIM 78166]|uniref:SDR family NAD(P)-dependent oxidoreductase n=1 Tax=Ammoniphilus sp. YIM 78166 TaxID=1644106 RepID=UPI00106F5EC2|nr:SDR family NAD(P)-dependent oxidoreductase [Ammoniphilus sp. YIM 78166]
MITGASRGLGYQLVKLFHEGGNLVFPLVRTQLFADLLTSEFKNRIVPIIADVGLDECETVIRTTLDHSTDCLDILINNAGISGREFEMDKVTTKEVNDLFNVHCLGAIRTVRATLQFLYNSNHPRIVNVSSRLGSLSMMSSGEFQHLKTSYSYRIAKAAQNMFTICLEKELNEKGISVNSIHPGKLKTQSASTDADMDVATGAKHIFQWLVDMDREYSGKYIQPGYREFNW